MATKSLCSIDGCGKPQHYRGMCSMHAERTRLHGDPHKGARPERKECSVEGCDSLACAKGLCTRHYKRLRAHGDPQAGGIAKGSTRRFIESVCEEPWPTDCVTWPFARNREGYGRVNWRNKPTNAHAVICRIAHGPRPSPKHEVCHSCGKGNEGCVNPAHLYWGTRAENVRDAMKHGTAYRFPILFGEDAPRAKHSDETIAEVKRLLSLGETQMAIAAKTGVSQPHVSQIKLGRVRANAQSGRAP